MKVRIEWVIKLSSGKKSSLDKIAGSIILDSFDVGKPMILAATSNLVRSELRSLTGIAG